MTEKLEDALAAAIYEVEDGIVAQIKAADACKTKIRESEADIFKRLTGKDSFYMDMMKEYGKGIAFACMSQDYRKAVEKLAPDERELLRELLEELKVFRLLTNATRHAQEYLWQKVEDEEMQKEA